MRFVSFRVSMLGFVLTTLAVGPPAAALRPDLVPEVFDVSIGRSDVQMGDFIEGCSGGTNNRLLLEYSLRSRNIGAGDLVMGAPMCPNCALFPGEVCGNPHYICSPAHGHAHFDSFAKAVLLDGSNQVVAESRKSGFCLLDYECADPKFSCSYQGISAGCSDVYERGLPCQYMDITDAALGDGLYTLRVTMDPDDVIDESNEGNNTVDVPVEISTGASSCPRAIANDTPRTIPDLGATQSSIGVSKTGWITRVRITGLELTHPAVGQLEVRLRSPLGTEVVVMDRVCGGTANVLTDLDDGAATPIACPATDGLAHRPSQPLAAFLGQEASGTWQLTVYDRSSSQTGSLQQWSLEVCTEPACTTFTSVASVDVPKPIPDQSNVVSVLSLPEGTGTVARVAVVGLRGTHSYVGDLEMVLTSPSNRSVTIMNRSCSSYDDFDLSLSNFAPSAIPCPPTDRLPHQPSNAFTAFLGDAADGEWRLTVHDRAPNDTGTLLGWGLRVCTVPSTAASCPSRPAAGCTQGTRARLQIQDNTSRDSRKLRWKLQGVTLSASEIGNPASSTGYAACIYSDDVLVQALPVASAGTCNGRVCWRKLSERGFRYRKRGGNKVGIDGVSLKSGNGNGRIELRGSGAELVSPLPLSGAVRIQLLRSDSARCWESNFDPTTGQGDPHRFDARHR